MRACVLTLYLVMLAGCRSSPTAGLSPQDAGFAEGPVIIQRGEHFYLDYRRVLDGDRFSAANPVLMVWKTKNAGYYYFSGRISRMEWGALVERPLAYDELEEQARRGQIYWLDPDGAKHPIPVRREA